MTKKQIVQISILILFLYIGIYSLLSGFGFYMNIFEYGYNYSHYFSLITVLLLSSIYIIYNKKDCSFSPYIRLSLYFIILIIVSSRIFMYYSFHYYSNYFLNTDFLAKKMIEVVLRFVLSFDIVLAILASSVLILNKAESYQKIKIGKRVIKI